MATTSSETDRSDNDRKFVAFGKKNTGTSQFNGIDDLCQADLLRPMPRPRTCSRKAKAKNFGLKAKAKD